MKFKFLNDDLEKKRFLYTFFSALVIGLIAHLFGMVNIVQSEDSINNINGFGAGISLGRWGLEIFGNLFYLLIGNRNLQFLNNSISLIILSLSSYILIRIFNIKNIKYCVLWSGIFISFPFVTSVFFYAFTSIYYSIAIFITFLGVYLTNKNKHGYIIAIVCSTIGLGLYQAFFPFMVSIYLLLIFIDLLKNDKRIKDIVVQGLKYIGILVISLLLYFIILKVLLFISHAKLGSYKGADNIGHLNFSDIPKLILNSYVYFFKFLLVSLSYNFAFKVSIIVLGFIFIYCTYYILFKNKKNKVSTLILSSILILLMPMAFNLVEIMTNSVGTHHLMIYPISLFFILPFLIFENYNFTNKFILVLKKITVILSTFVIINYVYQSNLNYQLNYYAGKQTENYCNSLVTQVKMTEGFYTDQEWIIIGDNSDDLINDKYWWNNAVESSYEIFEEGQSKISSVLFTRKFKPYVGNMSMKDRVHYLKNNRFINEVMGYNIKFADKETEELYKNYPIVQEMNTYPNYNSIKIIDNYVVIKLSE